jgi:hypothetical protein
MSKVVMTFNIRRLEGRKATEEEVKKIKKQSNDIRNTQFAEVEKGACPLDKNAHPGPGLMG